jgi:hypothetical protein
MPTDQNAVAAILAGIDQKIKEAEVILMLPLPAEVLHRAVDVLVDLREQRELVEAKSRGAE